MVRAVRWCESASESAMCERSVIRRTIAPSHPRTHRRTFARLAPSHVSASALAEGMKGIDRLAGAAALEHDGQPFRSRVVALGARDPERIESFSAGWHRLKVRVGLLVRLQRAQ